MQDQIAARNLTVKRGARAEAVIPIGREAEKPLVELIRLLDMGRPDGVHLEGTSSEVSVPFSTRQDDAFVGSRISLMFSYSGAVARDDGELSVYLNNEPIGSVPIGRSWSVRRSSASATLSEIGRASCRERESNCV